MTVIAQPDAHFGGFVAAQTDSLLSTAFLLTRNSALAEELVQDTLVALYPRWDRIMQADSAPAYVRRSLVNRFLNQRRSRSSTELVTAEVPQPPPDPRDFAAVHADRDQLRRALAVLPPRQRAAIVLRYFHDYADQQIADAMDCRIGTVRSLISRALTSLREDANLSDAERRCGQQGVTR